MAEAVEALDLAGAGDFRFEVVGESHFQAALRELVKHGEKNPKGEGTIVRVLIAPEPANPHDPHAVRILDTQNRTLGYFPREAARAYASCFDLMRSHNRALGTCPAAIFGGDRARPAIGIWLNLKPPETLLADLRETFDTPAGAAPAPTLAHGRRQIRAFLIAVGLLALLGLVAQYVLEKLP